MIFFFFCCEKIVNMEIYDAKNVDMWSLGVLIYVILVGKFPFEGKNKNE